jgi:hypothetical protein
VGEVHESLGRLGGSEPAGRATHELEEGGFELSLEPTALPQEGRLPLPSVVNPRPTPVVLLVAEVQGQGGVVAPKRVVTGGKGFELAHRAAEGGEQAG